MTDTRPITTNVASQMNELRQNMTLQKPITRKPVPTRQIVNGKSALDATSETSADMTSLVGIENSRDSLKAISTENPASMTSGHSRSSRTVSSGNTCDQAGNHIVNTADDSVEQPVRQDSVVVKAGQVQLGPFSLETLEYPVTRITTVKFSPDSQRLFAASGTKLISWNRSNQKIGEIQHDGSHTITSVSFSPGSGYVGLTTSTGEIQLAELNNRFVFRTLRTLIDVPRYTALSQDPRVFAYAPGDRSVILVDSASRTVFKKLKSLVWGHQKPVIWVSFASNGDVLSICQAGYFCLWERARDYRLLRNRVDALSKWMTLPQPSFVASNKSSQAIAVTSGELVTTRRTNEQHLHHWFWFRLPQRAQVVFMDFSSCGSRLYLCRVDGSCELWRVTSYRSPILHVAFSVEGWSPDCIFHPIALSPDEPRLAFTFPNGCIKTLDVQKAIQVYNIRRHVECAVLTNLSADGTTAASICRISMKEEYATHHSTVIIWDLKTTSTIHLLQIRSSGVRDAIFSADSQRLAVVSNDGVVTLWRVSTGKLITTVGQPIQKGFKLSCAIVSSDFCYVATVEHDFRQWGIRIWDTNEGTMKYFLGWYKSPGRTESDKTENATYSTPVALRFFNNTTRLVGGNDGGIFIFDIIEGSIQCHSSETSRPLRQAPWYPDPSMTSVKLGRYRHSYHWVDDLRISPDSETVAYLTKGGKACLYSLKTRDEPTIFGGWTSPDTEASGRAAISPDWRLVATTSYNRVVIWETSTNHIVEVLNPYEVDYPVDAVIFSPDSKYIFVLSLAGLYICDIKLLDAPTRVEDFPIRVGSLLVSAELGRIIVIEIEKRVDTPAQYDEDRLEVLLSSTRASEVQIWDYVKGVEIERF